MKKWHMIIDTALCQDCNNCLMACKDEHELNNWPGYTASQPRHGARWMNIMRKERGQYPLNDVAYRPTPCQHCEDAPCVAASGGAIVKRPDGIVLIDPDKAQGKQDLVKTCPYGAIFWNEELRVAQKCTMCAHLLDNEGWTKPRCVQVCPTGALSMVHITDEALAELAKNENLQILHPEYNTKPNVLYKNLYRYDAAFIAGSLAASKNGVVDCVEGAKVTVTNIATNQNYSATTDMFGDFKIDQLAVNSGKYKVEIEFKGTKKAQEVDLKESLNIGTIML